MKNQPVSRTYVVKGLLSLGFLFADPTAWATSSCGYPAMPNCALPADVAACLTPTATKPCVGGRQGAYPLIDNATQSTTKTPVEGCYNEKFARIYPIDVVAGKKTCSQHPNAPVRVELFYETSCTGNLPTCLSGANVNVVPVITSDAALGAIKYAMPQENTQPVTLRNSNPTADSTKFCDSLNGNGYVYNSVTKQCDVSVAMQCTLLGMDYDAANNKCVTDVCPASACTTAVTDAVCSGYSVKPTGQSCYCRGTAVTKDANGTCCGDQSKCAKPAVPMYAGLGHACAI